MYYALVTGASSGIGYEFLSLFAKKNYNLILVSRQEKKLIGIANELEKSFAIHTLVIPQDLTQAGAADKIFHIIQEKAIKVQYLVNNAGFYVKGPLLETTWEEEHKLIQLQCLTYTKRTKLFLPSIIKLGKGGILHVGSTGSFVPSSYNAVYCAAKSFVFSFSEAIAEEVSGTGINITTLCPGGTQTNFQDLDTRKKSLLFLVMEPSVVAWQGFNASMKGKRIVIPVIVNKLQVLFIRFMPLRLMARLASSKVSLD